MKTNALVAPAASSQRWLRLMVALGAGSAPLAMGQGYQVQGPPPPGAGTMPSAYAQQSFAPPAGAGLQNYQQPRAQAPQAYAPSPYATAPAPKKYTAPRSTPRTTPAYQQPAYQQQPAYAQPAYQQQPYQQMPAQQPVMPSYPAYGQQQPMPYPQSGHPSLLPKAPKPVKKTTPPVYADGSVSSQIASLKANDRTQDRRLTDLERQTFPAATNGGQPRLGQHQVVLGDSLSSIATRYGTSVEEIKRLNHRSTNIVMTGEMLTVPVRGAKGDSSGSRLAAAKSGGTHIVQRGESLSQIASSYHVSVKALQDANGIRNANVITPGQRLKIPGGKQPTAIANSKPKSSGKQYIAASAYPTKAKETLLVASNVPAPGSGLGQVTAPSGPRGVTSYRVEHGDTMENVAQNFGTTPGEIQRINKLSSPRLPEVGDEIVVPLPGSVSL